MIIIIYEKALGVLTPTGPYLPKAFGVAWNHRAISPVSLQKQNVIKTNAKHGAEGEAYDNVSQ